ncbi:hypothetical protein T03_1365 [Trichinella britovi]|uniref:Uncharacterized protein n=1 Tax=Trichinella britovi TaxID=45882 RepID=A0A0V1DFV7_TRIBR|nr:hypothetical protein T03_1365 [Trichinella britovi]
MQRSTRTWGTQRPPASTSKSWQPTSEMRSRLPESSATQQMRQSLIVLPCQQKQTKQEIHDTVDRAVRDCQTSLRVKLSHPEYQQPKTNLASACQSLKAILRQKDNEDKKQVRRDHQSKTKPRIYRPRLVWTEEDHGLQHVKLYDLPPCYLLPWKPSTVVSPTSPLSYQVQTEDGHLWCKHRNQLRKRYVTAEENHSAEKIESQEKKLKAKQ